jgi:transposase
VDASIHAVGDRDLIRAWPSEAIHAVCLGGLIAVLSIAAAVGAPTTRAGEPAMGTTKTAIHASTPTDQPVQITLGVDTHAEQHVAAALDQYGRLLGTRTLPTTSGGYATLLTWAHAYGAIERVGIEGTGSSGAGLARWLQHRGVVVVEVDRPNRRARRRQGKSDAVAAEAAARAAHARTATGQPKAGDGHVEAMRALRIARRSAIKARTQAQAAKGLHALVVTAPDALRAHLRSRGIAALVATAARWRSATDPSTAEAGTKLALRSIARR